MQEQTINPNQLNLFNDFIGQEIDYKNDFVEYIPTSSNDSSIVHSRAVTSNSCKTAKTFSDNIIEHLKTEKFIKKSESHFHYTDLFRPELCSFDDYDSALIISDKVIIFDSSKILQRSHITTCRA